MKVPVSIIILFSKHNLSQDSEKKELFELTQKSVSWADQIVLYDTGEEDVVDFSKERNKALKEARNEWVLFVDSDEVVADGTQEKLMKIIKENGADLFWVKRKDFFVGKELKYGEAGEIKLIRLGKKSKINFVRPVHEVMDLKGRAVLDSGICLHHYAHSSVSGFLKKIGHYSYLEAASRIEKGQSFGLGEMAELLFFPVGKFILNFVLKLGFLDGYRGLVYALMMSLHSLLVRVFLYELSLGKIRKESDEV